MIKFKVGYWKDEVSEVVLVSETAAFATIREAGRKNTTRLKKNNVIFDTFDDAKTYMTECARRKVGNCEAQLQSAKALLKKINDMQKPEKFTDV